MRFSIPHILPSLLLAASASASEANVYLFNGGNSQHIDSQSLSTSASNARLLFAQRLDVAQFHSLKNANVDAIQVLNDFGGRPRRMFSGDANHNRPKAMLVIEGVENVQDIAPIDREGTIASFRIQDPPTPSANARLLQDMSFQAKSCKNLEYSELFYDEASRLLQHANAGEKFTDDVKMYTSNGRVLAQLSSLEHMSSKFGSSGAEYKTTATSIRGVIASFFEQSANNDWEVIVVAMPPQKSGGIFKRSSTASWGSYSLPKRQESGRPDFLPNDFAGTETNVENPPANDIDYNEFLDPTEPQQSEDTTEPQFSDVANLPGDETTSTDSKAISEAIEAVEEWFEEVYDEIIDELGLDLTDSIQILQDNYTSSPLGILPTCYSTFDACVSTTYNCSGHGSCYKKYDDERRDGKRACYVCGCQNTYRRDSSGRIIKTTQWAGPACQKKDVSMPFWLLGGLTVLLVSIVAWGIGLLYSMGSEDLPSVIGAGVAGPRAK